MGAGYGSCLHKVKLSNIKKIKVGIFHFIVLVLDYTKL